MVNTGWEEIICNPALIFLSFSDSPISNPRLVEEILDRHFPSVTDVYTSIVVSGRRSRDTAVRIVLGSDERMPPGFACLG